MNYELALKLKNAGFPQHSVPEEGDFYEGGEDVSSPTLSELIEACGNDFISLERNSSEGNIWCCLGDKGFQVFGKSPEEAVANLWLALNEKN